MADEALPGVGGGVTGGVDHARVGHEQDDEVLAGEERRHHGEPMGATTAAVAHRWGFSNPSHFSRTFRGAYGMSPSDWQSLATSAFAPAVTGARVRATGSEDGQLRLWILPTPRTQWRVRQRSPFLILMAGMSVPPSAK